MLDGVSNFQPTDQMEILRKIKERIEVLLGSKEINGYLPREIEYKKRTDVYEEEQLRRVRDIEMGVYRALTDPVWHHEELTAVLSSGGISISDFLPLCHKDATDLFLLTLHGSGISHAERWFFADRVAPDDAVYLLSRLTQLVSDSKGTTRAGTLYLDSTGDELTVEVYNIYYNSGGDLSCIVQAECALPEISRPSRLYISGRVYGLSSYEYVLGLETHVKVIRAVAASRGAKMDIPTDEPEPEPEPETPDLTGGSEDITDLL